MQEKIAQIFFLNKKLNSPSNIEIFPNEIEKSDFSSQFRTFLSKTFLSYFFKIFFGHLEGLEKLETKKQEEFFPNKSYIFSSQNSGVHIFLN